MRGIVLSDIVEFIISTEKKEYLLGEPILVNCEVKNISEDTIDVLDKFSADYDIVTFHTIKSSDKDRLFVPYAVMDFWPEPVKLQPEESVFGSSKIFYGSKGWTFKTPGNYKIWATYNGLTQHPEKFVNSNVLEIKVKPPANDEEKEQVDLIMGDEQGLFLLYDGGDDLKDGLQKLGTLVTKFEKSVLSPYVNFSIGESLSREFKDFTKKEVRPADPLNALDCLHKSIENLPKELACQAYLRMADITKGQSDVNQEKNILKEFVDKFSNNKRYENTVKKAEKKLHE